MVWDFITRQHCGWRLLHSIQVLSICDFLAYGLAANGEGPESSVDWQGTHCAPKWTTGTFSLKICMH